MAVSGMDKECISYLNDNSTEINMLQSYSKIKGVFVIFNTIRCHHRLLLNGYSVLQYRLKCLVETVLMTLPLRNCCC
jgi:hypothetical protein